MGARTQVIGDRRPSEPAPAARPAMEPMDESGGDEVVLSLAAHVPGALGASGSIEDVRTLPEWAQQRIAALERANRRLVERVLTAERLARHDDISGLPNHRSATNMLERTWQRHQLGHQPFALLFMDGDNLHRYNEQSYEAGNQMIADLAETLVGGLRPTDYVARWLSGDEFLAILPDTDSERAERVAERLRQSVEDAFRDAAIPVTISIGVASYPEDGTTMATLLERAVSSNAVAKRAGKNRVVTFQQTAAA